MQYHVMCCTPKVHAQSAHGVCNFGCFGYHNYARLTDPSIEASAIISA